MVKASGKQQLPVPVDTAPAFDPTTAKAIVVDRSALPGPFCNSAKCIRRQFLALTNLRPLGDGWLCVHQFGLCPSKSRQFASLSIPKKLPPDAPVA